MPDYALGNHVAPLGLAFAQGDAAAGAIPQRRLRRRARLVEPQAAQRLQGGVRAVRRRPPDRQPRRCPDRLRQRRRTRRSAARSASRSTRRARCWSPTMSATRSGASRPRAQRPRRGCDGSCRSSVGAPFVGAHSSAAAPKRLGRPQGSPLINRSTSPSLNPCRAAAGCAPGSWRPCSASPWRPIATRRTARGRTAGCPTRGWSRRATAGPC